MKRKIIFLFCIAGSIASTQGFKNPPVGSSALSQAGAFVAQSDDATATVFNPAGLIQIDKQEIILGTTYIYSKTKFSGDTYSTEKKFSPVFLPYFFYAKKMSENFGFGIGMFSPYGQTVKWGFDAVKKWGYMVPYYSSMQTAQTSLAFAFKINHSLSTGFGLNFFTSRVVQNSLLPSEQLLKMKATGQTCSPSFGILYKKEKYSIGLNYQCP
ncbi:outer membrane protein transport protein, partial [bacterium]|nr:outer membrane protein transport protein [bacterium]